MQAPQKAKSTGLGGQSLALLGNSGQVNKPYCKQGTEWCSMHTVSLRVLDHGRKVLLLSWTRKRRLRRIRPPGLTSHQCQQNQYLNPNRPDTHSSSSALLSAQYCSINYTHLVVNLPTLQNRHSVPLLSPWPPPVFSF